MASGQLVWLTMAMISPNTREVDEAESESASRYVAGTEMFIDSSSSLRIEEEIDLALPRLALELLATKQVIAVLPEVFLQHTRSVTQEVGRPLAWGGRVESIPRPRGSPNGVEAR